MEQRDGACNYGYCHFRCLQVAVVFTVDVILQLMVLQQLGLVIILLFISFPLTLWGTPVETQTLYNSSDGR